MQRILAKSAIIYFHCNKHPDFVLIATDVLGVWTKSASVSRIKTNPVMSWDFVTAILTPEDVETVTLTSAAVKTKLQVITGKILKCTMKCIY